MILFSFCSLGLVIDGSFFGSFRIHGLKVMLHYEATIYTAHRLEMCEIVEMTLFYFIDRPQVHSPLSELPFMVSISIHIF